MGLTYPRQYNSKRRSGNSRDRRMGKGEWALWFVAYLALALSLLIASFVPWFVLDDTDAAISVAEIMLYAMDGPDRNWLVQEAWPHGIVFLYTPFLLVPLLLYAALATARDRPSSAMFLISLAGFVLISFGASAAVDDAYHTVAYGFVVTEILFVVAGLSLLGFLLRRFEDKVAFGVKVLMMKRRFRSSA